MASGLAESGDREAAPSARAWATLAILLLLIILAYVDRSIVSLLVDPIKRDLQIDDIQMSLIQGLSFALSYALFSIPAGWMADRFSKRWVIYGGVTLWSFATMTCGLAHSYAQLFLARIGVGIGEAALPPAAYAIIADVFPKRRLALALGIFSAGSAAGAALALTIGGFAISWVEKATIPFDLSVWQIVFMVIGLPGVLIAFLAFLMPETQRNMPAAQGASAPDNIAYFQWLKRRARYLSSLAIGIGCFSGMTYGIAGWTPAYLSRHFGLSPSEIGLYLGPIAGISGVVGFIGYGWITDRLAARNIPDLHFRMIICITVLLSTLTILCYTLIESLIGLFAVLAVIYLIAPITAPIIAHLQMSTPLAFRGRTVAIYTMASNLIAMVVGPSVVALFTETVLGGAAHVGTGIACMAAVLGPIALLMLLWGIEPGREALHAASQEADALPIRN